MISFASRGSSSVPHIWSGFGGLAGPAYWKISVAVEREAISFRWRSTICPVFGETLYKPNRKPQWKLLKYLFYGENPVVVLSKWLIDGNKLKAHHLQNIVWRLRYHKKYIKALQVSECMRNNKMFEFTPGDCAIQLDLIAKVHGIDRAENYFLDLPKSAKNECTYCTLLYHYAKEKMTEKAEQCMEKIKELGLVKNVLPFNWIMLLCMANGQVEKVPLMVKQLKELDFQPDSRTYCLWISACSAMFDLDDVEIIVNAIKSVDGYNVNWHIYSTLANIYIKSGHVDKAKYALKELESKITPKDHVAYNHLITMYGSLGNKEEVHRIWGSLKINSKKIRYQSYKSVLSSLVKAGDIEGAEKFFEEWLSNSRHDCMVSNILLAAYVRKGMLEMAETFHARIIEKGVIPKCRTWEILSEGYLESNQMDKAVITMMKALSKVKSSEWHPRSKNIMAILKYFEKQGNIECVDEFLKLLRHINFVTTEIYNSLLLTYVKAGKPVFKILEHMANDNVKADEETERLLFDMIIS